MVLSPLPGGVLARRQRAGRRRARQPRARSSDFREGGDRPWVRLGVCGHAGPDAGARCCEPPAPLQRRGAGV